MRVLITGNKGFLGSHLQSTLDAEGHEVFGFDSEDTPIYPEVDVVFHFAAMNGTRRFYERPFDVEFNDLSITLEVLRQYLNTNTRIVYASSSELYNDSYTHSLINPPFKESDPVLFWNVAYARWSYAVPKLTGETLLHNARAQYGLDSVILRYFNVYGPRHQGHFIPEFMERALNGQYYVYGNDARSFMYVDDAIDTTKKLSFSNELDFHTYNIGNPHSIDNPLHVGQMILERMSIDKEIKILPGQVGSPKTRVPDITRTEGMTELTSLREGINKTVDYYLKEKKI